MNNSSIRPAVVANTFYPGSPKKLSLYVQELLQEAKEKRTIERPENIIGLLSPHAGYVYSGYAAATAYSLLGPEDFKTVIIVSPSHRELFDGVSFFPGGFYETPLGKIPIDQKLINKILDSDKEKIVIPSESGHEYEHALEVQLPFLQEALPGFKLVPLVIGKQTSKICKALGDLLADVLKDEEKVLLVASSDLSHFYTSEIAKKLDKACLDIVSDFNAEKLIAGLEENKFEACGAGPIASVMLASKKLGAKNSKVTHYCDSGDVTGDRSSVVGYMGAVFFK